MELGLEDISKDIQVGIRKLKYPSLCRQKVLDESDE